MSNCAKRTKRCILDALIRLLAVRPFSAITVDDIAEEASVSRSTFYKYFSSKYDLAQDFFEEFKVRAKDKVLSVLKRANEPDAFYREVVDDFNAASTAFATIRKIKDDYIDMEKELLTGIQTGIARQPTLPPFDVELLSHNLFMTWDYCFSLDHPITVEEAKKIDERIDLVHILKVMTLPVAA